MRGDQLVVAGDQRDNRGGHYQAVDAASSAGESHPVIKVRPANRHRLRLAGSVAWTLVSGLLALMTGSALGSSIADSRYDDQQNRAPALRIAVAAAAFLVALAALRMAVKRLRHPDRQHSNIALAVLVVLTLVLIFLLIIVAIGSGPL